MYSQIAANKRKTVFLIVAFIVVIGAFGWLISEVQGMPYLTIGVIIGATIYATIGYFLSAKIALAMSGAKEVRKNDAPRLYRIVENLSITAGMPMPKVYIIKDPAMNAFATGRKPEDGVVAVTTGLLETLEDNELEGVIAHEISHIQNYDIRVMAVVLILVTIVASISDLFLRMTFIGGRNNRNGGHWLLVVGLVVAIIAPIVATLLKLAVSRRREFLADASGVLLTRYPDGLAKALRKIELANRPMRKANNATAHMFLANPFGHERRGQAIRMLFSTHPPTQDRIAALRQMGREL